MQPSDGDAFAAVARAQLPWLYPLACRLVGVEAEDAVQETLIKAHRRFDTLRERDAAPAWFRQILLNTVRDRHRRRARLPREEPLDEASPPWPAHAGAEPLSAGPGRELSVALPGVDAEDVWQVLERLDPRYRVPLVLVHMEGMPTREVAGLFGVAQGTVLSWLHRGRQRFERELWAYAAEHGLLAEASHPRG